MRAEYDTEADALAIDLVPDPHAEVGEVVGERAIVALDRDERPVSLELLYPGEGLEPLIGAARRYGLDAEAVDAAARAALAAPDREVQIDVGVSTLV